MQEPRFPSFPHAPVTYIPDGAQGKTHCRRHSQMTTTTTTATIAATVTPTAAPVPRPADAASLIPCEEGDSGTVCVSVAIDWHYGTKHRPGWHPLSLGINIFTNLCLSPPPTPPPTRPLPPSARLPHFSPLVSSCSFIVLIVYRLCPF